MDEAIMNNDKKIAQDVLIERLGKRLNYPVTRAHFAVLVHGWSRKHPDQAPLFATLRYRKKREGYLWFNPTEVQDLSAYAGYDLTQD